MNSINIKLKINGNTVALSHSFLEKIISKIPDISENSKVFEILAQDNNKKVRYYTTQKKFLNDKTINIFLNDKSEDVVTNLLKNPTVSKKLNHKQIMKIIKQNHDEHLSTLAMILYKFTQIKSNKVSKILSKSKNPKVRFNLVHWGYNENIIPISVLKKLSNDNDTSVAMEASKLLKSRVIPDFTCHCSTKICFCDF